jgi:hypothetical protein
MKVNIEELLNDCGLDEPVYPGKRLVQKLPQPGEFKSHSIVYDWRAPDLLRIEIKAGISGKTLDPKELANYPVSFQAPTYMEIEAENDNEDEEESGSGSKGKSGGGGKKPKKKKESLKAFASVVEGKIPSTGDIKKLVVMGKEIAENAMGAVLGALSEQIKHAKIAPTELIAKASDLVTKYTPPSFLQPKGDEDVKYKYDRTKNEDIGRVSFNLK